MDEVSSSLCKIKGKEDQIHLKMLVTELESVWIISSNFSATARDSYQPSVLGFSYHPVSASGTHASVDVDTKGGLPPSFTVCIAMVKTQCAADHRPRWSGYTPLLAAASGLLFTLPSTLPTLIQCHLEIFLHFWAYHIKLKSSISRATLKPISGEHVDFFNISQRSVWGVLLRQINVGRVPEVWQCYWKS